MRHMKTGNDGIISLFQKLGYPVTDRLRKSLTGCKAFSGIESLSRAKNVNPEHVAAFEKEIGVKAKEFINDQYLEDLHPFIFYEAQPESLGGDEYPSLPFKCISVEMSGDRPLFFSAEDSALHLVQFYYEVSYGDIRVLDFVYSMKGAKEGRANFYFIESKAEKKDYPYINRLLGHIKNRQIGSEKISRIFWTRKNSKSPKKNIIRTIVHVCKKEQIKTEPTLISKNIEWSHRWEVMGHWRKCRFIGKDRDGKYTVNGMTWVMEHQKGKGELVKKVRIVGT